MRRITLSNLMVVKLFTNTKEEGNTEVCNESKVAESTGGVTVGSQRLTQLVGVTQKGISWNERPSGSEV